MEEKLFEYYFSKLEKFLRNQNLRNSNSRNDFLNFLCAKGNGLNSHFEADEVTSLISKMGYKVSRATVFRNLTLFAEIGILRKSKFGENHFHYELTGYESKSHHHLICKNCGNFIEFENDTLLKLSKTIASENNFEISDYRFEVFGICSNCKKRII